MTVSPSVAIIHLLQRYRSPQSEEQETAEGVVISLVIEPTVCTELHKHTRLLSQKETNLWPLIISDTVKFRFPEFLLYVLYVKWHMPHLTMAVKMLVAGVVSWCCILSKRTNWPGPYRDPQAGFRKTACLAQLWLFSDS